MGDDDHRRVVLVQNILQPADRVDVEVVRRLVEQQHVGIREQRLREQHAQLPARRDIAHRTVVILDRDADAEQQFACAGLGRVAAVLGEFGLELGGVHVVVVRRVRVRIDRIALGHRGPHFGVAHHDDVEHPHVFVGELVLTQFAEANVRLEHDGARTLLQVAAENLHERRLAAAVRADETVAVAFAELDRDILEQGLRPELHGDIGGRQHSASLRMVIGEKLGILPSFRGPHRGTSLP